jgi:hypothetical protein
MKFRPQGSGDQDFGPAVDQSQMAPVSPDSGRRPIQNTECETGHDNDMTGPNPKKQKAGWATLEPIFADAGNVSVIHYSCESFYDRPNGASPRITSIAVRKLDSGQTLSFSIHQVAERGGVAFGEIEGTCETSITGRRIGGPVSRHGPAGRLRRDHRNGRPADRRHAVQPPVPSDVPTVRSARHLAVLTPSKASTSATAIRSMIATAATINSASYTVVVIENGYISQNKCK